MNQVELVILAGGRGSRLGVAKSQILINGRPVLEDLARRLAWTGPTTRVKSARDACLPGETSFDRSIADRHPGEGPLGGIVSALAVARTPRVLVLPIDLCRITREQLLTLIDEAGDAGIAFFERNTSEGIVLEPLPMLISDKAFKPVQQAFSDGRRSLRSLADVPGARVLTAPAHWSADMWTNVNTPADLARIGGTLAANSAAARPDSVG